MLIPQNNASSTTGTSMEDRSSRRTERVQHSVHYEPYPSFSSALNEQNDSFPMPLPLPDIIDSKELVKRPTASPAMTPETPKKSGRTRAHASKRSFSSPGANLSFNTKEFLAISPILPPNNDFEQGTMIGKGSQGTVYKAFHKKEQRWYAIKVLNRINQNEAQKNRLAEEISNIEKVSPHPHLLSYENAWEANGEIFLQMELCKESLDDFLNSWQTENPNSHLPEQTLWEYLAGITSGIHRLHTHRFVHRDIKPANIFVDSSGNLRVGDFGLLVRENENDSNEGDCRYLSREALCNDNSSSFSSDIFSIGATMFETACLIKLPQSGDLWDTLRNGCVEPHFPSDYSDSLKSIIGKMMHPDPTKRPSTSSILALSEVKNAILRQNGHLSTRNNPGEYHGSTRGSTVPPSPRRSRSLSSPYFNFTRRAAKPTRALFQ